MLLAPADDAEVGRIPEGVKQFEVEHLCIEPDAGLEIRDVQNRIDVDKRTAC